MISPISELVGALGGLRVGAAVAGATVSAAAQLTVGMDEDRKLDASASRVLLPHG
jgi:hypothetical protein